jgi:hypothetical protein
MTAEIVIMNRHAVVMAADSVVTNTAYDGGKKTYPSANKLFALSYKHSIGVMTYGNADLIDLPWETIIKSYRKVADKKRFKKLIDCVHDFINFLETEELFSDSLKEHFCEGNYRNFNLVVANEISKSICRRVSENPNFVDDEGEAAEVVKRIIKTMESFPHVVPVNNIGYMSENSDQLIEMEEQIYSNYYVFLKKDLDILRSLYFERVIVDESSGIVICGFGEEEYLPVTASLNITEFRKSKLVYTISIDEGSNILPFAQRDAADTFMSEISPRLSRDLCNLLSMYAPKVTEKIVDELSQFTKGYYFSKYEVLESFPVSELAFVAENLVNLSSFQQRLSRNLETVGGPIDVAVISKGDGFIWLKRKHYFNPDLNPHFFARYNYNETTTHVQNINKNENLHYKCKCKKSKGK